MAIGFLLAAAAAAAAANRVLGRSYRRWALTALLLPVLVVTVASTRPLHRTAQLFSLVEVRTANLRRWGSLRPRAVPGSGAFYPSVIPPDHHRGVMALVTTVDGRARSVHPMVADGDHVVHVVHVRHQDSASVCIKVSTTAAPPR